MRLFTHTIKDGEGIHGYCSVRKGENEVEETQKRMKEQRKKIKETQAKLQKEEAEVHPSMKSVCTQNSSLMRWNDVQKKRLDRRKNNRNGGYDRHTQIEEQKQKVESLTKQLEKQVNKGLYARK